ncbi:hypothetical protein GJAV_G00039210 [Gymnothorax javanicus]|nr:hypothetical protein GJAV_G00039210 [Gymnothorax javanicus]
MCVCVCVCALVKFLEGQQFVASVHKQMGRALLEHTVSSYPQSPERFSRLMCVLQELCGLSRQVELYLDCRHRDGDLPGNSLLIEMLHAKVATS